MIMKYFLKMHLVIVTCSSDVINLLSIFLLAPPFAGMRDRNAENVGATPVSYERERRPSYMQRVKSIQPAQIIHSRSSSYLLF